MAKVSTSSEAWMGAGPGPEGVGSVLDLEQFEGLRQLAAASGDPAFLSRLVEQYLDEAASRWSELRQAVRQGGPAAVSAVAHALRGASATMGARSVASVCDKLEEAAGRGEVTGSEGLDRMSAALEGAASALRAQVRSSADQSEGFPAVDEPVDSAV